MAKQQPLTTDENVSAAEGWILEQGYPDMETYHMEEKLVKLGYEWHHNGGDNVLAEFNSLLSKLFAKGWTPHLLDGQQEMWLGVDLTNKINKQFKERNK